jgi:hypothetical protein
MLGADIIHRLGPDCAGDIKTSNYFSRVLFDTRERSSSWSQEITQLPHQTLVWNFDRHSLTFYLQAHLFCKSAFLYRRHECRVRIVLTFRQTIFHDHCDEDFALGHLRERELPNFSCSNAPNRLIDDYNTHRVTPALQSQGQHIEDLPLSIHRDSISSNSHYPITRTAYWLTHALQSQGQHIE